LELSVAAGEEDSVCADEEGRVLAALDVDVAVGGTREDAVAGLPRFAVELPVAAGGGGTVSAAADVEGRASVALDVDKAYARDDAEAGFFFVSVRPEVDFCLWGGKLGVEVLLKTDRVWEGIGVEEVGLGVTGVELGVRLMMTMVEMREQCCNIIS